MKILTLIEQTKPIYSEKIFFSTTSINHDLFCDIFLKHDKNLSKSSWMCCVCLFCSGYDDVVGGGEDVKACFIVNFLCVWICMTLVVGGWGDEEAQ